MQDILKEIFLKKPSHCYMLFLIYQLFQIDELFLYLQWGI